MKEKKPIEKLIDQVGDLLQKIQNHDKPIEDIPPEFVRKLDILEKAFKHYEELNHKTYQEADINMQALRSEFYRSSLINEKNKKLIQRLNIIAKDAKQLQAKIAKSLGSQSVVNKQDKLAKDRRRKFKSLGGDRGWLRL